ncbi:MAG TPA: ribonuclease J [Acidobacteria bacterium]|nr:ribonuclease J [Acidobacteriota bacterium]
MDVRPPSDIAVAGDGGRSGYCRMQQSVGSLGGASVVDITPLGGVGEFGMNMLALSCAETTVLIDAGVMFPEPGMPGVDLIIPDLSYLEERPDPLAALFLTHGHEDHIGAVPYIWPLLGGPIYGTRLTLALVERKLTAHGFDPTGRLVPLEPGDAIPIGPLTVRGLRVTHSMPDCLALAIDTPAGVIIHSGDFKIDHSPVDGQTIDLHRFAELGQSGVLVMFGDSTNADRPGVTGSEIDVREAFEEILADAKGKVVVALFASSLHRIQLLVDLAQQAGRQVAFVGRGVVENVEIAQRLGHLRIPPDTAVHESHVMALPPERALCIVTGSQGEPMAALSRIALDDHRHVSLLPDDVVVFSARAIPGNERAIGRVMNQIARRGAAIVSEDSRHVHVSGHASQEELKLLLALVRPRYFVPIHGEYRQLAHHGRVAAALGNGETTVLTVQNGDLLRFDRNAGGLAGHVRAGRILIDGTRTGEVGDEVLRDRRHLSTDGLAVPVVAISRQDGALAGAPDIITRGLVLDALTDDVLAEAPEVVRLAVADASVEERTDQALIGERIRTELQRFFRKRTGRRPMVVPVVMEI